MKDFLCRKKGLVLIFVLVLLLGLIFDFVLGNSAKMSFKRPSAEEGDTEVTLYVSKEDGVQDLEYNFKLSAKNPTADQAEAYFAQAKEEIDSSIFGDQEVSCVKKDLILADTYADGHVNVSWDFTPYGYVETDGSIYTDALLLAKSKGQESQLIEGLATLSVGNYKEVYTFSFELYPPEESEQDQLLMAIDQDIEAQEEADQVTLPEELEGKQLSWKNSLGYMTPKILAFGVIILLLLYLREKEEAKEAKQRRQKELMADYPEIVSKLAILLGSGMTIRQSWNRISAQYAKERQERSKEKREGFELMVEANIRMLDGESERKAYQKFGEEGENPTYRRLSRLLVQNLEKGSRCLSELLEEESLDAFEQRKRNVRKLGEEAGTKLLIPLMMMMCLVFVLVLAPALVNMSI